ncbi:carboxylic acid reductase [[Mycobacterium] nativiensis]|uniref:Carboxylic acid reductase n=1 Tax=[Mycobacterium] nativiensis TaxID=2855503 RepID=A0ABU5XT42_9MYCO|nr:carboxylic acid reductase [Mycolicibacter sp. MYC340]MEB3031142.1 carboxylic acid reductase [Mycolicibacter sp. MYC340]
MSTAPTGTRTERLTGRIAGLYATDAQFRAAQPNPDVIAAARRPGLRLAQVLQTLADGYADRPAVGERAREAVTDPVTGRTTARLLPRFETISYRELWGRAGAIAADWRHHPIRPLVPGDFVATIGFASADYLSIDLACAYLGLVSVPLQHNASTSQLTSIIAEVQPQVLAVGAAYLEFALDSAMDSESLRHVLVFDHQPELVAHRDALARARERIRSARVSVVIETLDEVVQRGRGLPPEPLYTADTDERLAMILYTSGSTGAPKGAMHSERTLARLWTASATFLASSDTPVFNVNFMPLNHLGGRLPLVSSFMAGGTSYFVPEPDLSTLFDDWSLVRPTELPLVPRVIDMLYQRHRNAVAGLIARGATPEAAEADAAAELRDGLLGGRVLGGFVGTAPLAPEMAEFLDSALDVHLSDGYGLTEVGGVTRDGAVLRPPVLAYKLVDVPELGYFTTDRPHPRGELLIKSATATMGYFKRSEVTAEVFDEDGYYRTGDVMAELAPDRLAYVDRSKNVLKLAQGEFVAVARLDAVFAAAPGVGQIYVYGNSERAYLLAVIVPTSQVREESSGDAAALKSMLRDSLRQIAKAAELQSYELPVDFLIENEPFTAANGLVSGVGKLLRPRLKAHYGQRLEQLYIDIDLAAADELRALRNSAADQPVLETVRRAAVAVLGSAGAEVDANAHFTDLGGDSLSALTFSELLSDVFGVDVPVGGIISPTSTLAQLADHVAAQRESASTRPTAATVHGPGAVMLRASDLTLDKFIDPTTLAEAGALPHATGESRTVLLTGANGYLGRFIALHWLERLSQTGGTLICIVRGTDDAAAWARLEQMFDSGDAQLRRRFRALAAEHLEVIAGDIGEPDLGLDVAVWNRLGRSVDLIVHAAALVNHVLPYEQLFGPNVVGTAELIRLAITTRIKPITFLSTVAVAMTVDPDDFTEDGDIREINPVRPIDDGYASGYGNSKWAGEVLLREAFDHCELPVTVFRSDMILAHSRYTGQLNVPDAFTRLAFSLLVTGLAPRSFYEIGPAGDRPRAHYSGLPVDFVAEAIAALGARGRGGFRSFDVMNPHDDGISLDTFVDWLGDAGHPIERIHDYDAWLARFETVLRALPEKQRRHSVLPLLGAYRKPQQPLRGAPAPTGAFRAAVQAAEIGEDKDIPHLSAELVEKYVADLKYLGMLSG